MLSPVTGIRYSRVFMAPDSVSRSDAKIRSGPPRDRLVRAAKPNWPSGRRRRNQRMRAQGPDRELERHRPAAGRLSAPAHRARKTMRDARR